MATENKEYLIPANISNADLVTVLRKLETDADEQLTSQSKSYTLRKSENCRARAMYFHGQVQLLNEIIMCLSGEAEAEECEPTVTINRWQDIA